MEVDLIEELYANKEVNYFSLERQIFKDAVKENGLKILDIGCGTGILGAHFKKNQNATVYGVEISRSAYEKASKNLDRVIRGNIETLEIDFERDFFDVIVMGDVVEHLVNPIDTIRRLLPFLRPGGKIHITVPNVRHWSVVKPLLFSDNWEYKDWGILDYTHMKFFTKRSFSEMLNKIDQLTIIRLERVIQKGSKSSVFNLLTFNVFSGFLASHTFVSLEKLK